MHAQIGQFRLDRPELPLGVEGGLFDLGIAQLHQHGVGFHGRARQHQNALNTARGQRRNPENLFRHQRPVAAHPHEHFASLHGVGPGVFDQGRGRLEPRESNRDDEQRAQAGD